MLMRFVLLASVVATAIASPSYYGEEGERRVRHGGRHGYSDHGWYRGYPDDGDSYPDREPSGGYRYHGGRHYGDDGDNSHRGRFGYGDEDEENRDGDDEPHPPKHQSDGKQRNSGHGGGRKPHNGDWNGEKEPHHGGWEDNKGGHGRAGDWDGDKWGRDGDHTHDGGDARDDRLHHGAGRDSDHDSGGQHPHQGDGNHGHQVGSDHNKKNTPGLSEVLRRDSDVFVTGIIRWVNGLVGEELAASFTVDTTFSLTKSGETKTNAVYSSSTLDQFFLVIRKAVEQPQNVDLIGEEAQSIVWKPNGDGADEDNDEPAAEVEGGAFATVQITCSSRMLLNVSIATSGSTPTIRSLPVENRGLYLDVDIFDGDITATDAQGSIVGVIKSRHYPGNVGQVLSNWTTAVQDCARRQELDVQGAVGGGWTVYTADDEADGGYKMSAVGYAESFRFSFSAATPSALSVAEDTVGCEVPTTETTSSIVKALARSASFAYTRGGLACGQSSPAVTSCGSRVIMTELHAVHATSPALAFNMLPQRLVSSHDASLIAPVVIALVGIASVVASLILVTLRRRKGYAPLAQV